MLNALELVYSVKEALKMTTEEFGECAELFSNSYEYSDAKVHAFRKFRAPISGKAVHTFPEQSAVV